MIGKPVLQLDKEDLITVLASHYKVKRQDINVIPFMTTIGFGTDEHEAPSVRVEVILSNNEALDSIRYN